VLAFQSPGTVGELECHSAVSILPVRAREGNNGTGGRTRQYHRHCGRSRVASSCTYHSSKENKDIFSSYLIESCTEGQVLGLNSKDSVCASDHASPIFKHVRPESWSAALGFSIIKRNKGHCDFRCMLTSSSSRTDVFLHASGKAHSCAIPFSTLRLIYSSPYSQLLLPPVHLFQLNTISSCCRVWIHLKITTYQYDVVPQQRFGNSIMAGFSFTMGSYPYLSLATSHRYVHKPPRIRDSLLRSALGCLLLLLWFDLCKRQMSGCG
jgi:hypothetical protein